MIDRPFYSSIKIIVLMPLLVLLVNVILIVIIGLAAVNQFSINKISHFLGGASIYISAAGILWHSVQRKLIVLGDIKVFRLLVYGFLCFAIICWEILEYVLIFPKYPEYLSYIDTITDMVSGLIGGLVAMFFVRRPI